MPIYPETLGLVETGVTLPVTVRPSGTFFLHTPIGRKILYPSDGTNWIPIEAYGNLTIYVDKTDGTDNLNNGIGVDASAFKTIQYAIDMLPPVVGGNININIDAETYTENLIITRMPQQPKGKYFKINGTFNIDASLVATGGAAGAGSTPARVAGAFVVDAHTNKLIRFTSGLNNGDIRVIGQTTVGNIYLLHGTLAAAPQNGDTYDILSWGTEIVGHHKIMGGRSNYNNVGQLTFYNIKFTGDANTEGVIYCDDGYVGVTWSNIISNASSKGIHADVGAYINIYRCIIIMSATTNEFGVLAEWNSQVDVLGSRVIGKGDGTGVGVLSDLNSSCSVDGCEITAFYEGTLSWNDGLVSLYTLSGITNFIHGCSQYGCGAERHSLTTYTGATYVTFAKKLDGTADVNGVANTGADAVTYCSVLA